MIFHGYRGPLKCDEDYNTQLIFKDVDARLAKKYMLSFIRTPMFLHYISVITCKEENIFYLLLKNRNDDLPLRPAVDEVELLVVFQGNLLQKRCVWRLCSCEM